MKKTLIALSLAAALAAGSAMAQTPPPPPPPPPVAVEPAPAQTQAPAPAAAPAQFFINTYHVVNIAFPSTEKAQAFFAWDGLVPPTSGELVKVANGHFHVAATVFAGNTAVNATDYPTLPEAAQLYLQKGAVGLCLGNESDARSLVKAAGLKNSDIKKTANGDYSVELALIVKAVHDQSGATKRK
ncbi:MAG: hypothetical protein V4496_03280 [Pseudomonadota bacterium]